MYHEEQAIEKEQAIKETEVGKRRESREQKERRKETNETEQAWCVNPGDAVFLGSQPPRVRSCIRRAPYFYV